MSKISVVLADDHMIVREGLRQLLELEYNINVVDEVGDGLECVKAVVELNPDILILDINMPGLDGFGVLNKLKAKQIKTRVIVLTFYDHVDMVERAIDCGAYGYILKESEYAMLIKAINVVMNGEKFIQPSLAAKLRKRNLFQKTTDEHLTKRELEIIRLVVAGQYNKEIAFNLNISEKTVKNHISSIFRKINVSDRTQAAVYAIKNNLVKI